MRLVICVALAGCGGKAATPAPARPPACPHCECTDKPAHAGGTAPKAELAAVLAGAMTDIVARCDAEPGYATDPDLVRFFTACVANSATGEVKAAYVKGDAGSCRIQTTSRGRFISVITPDIGDFRALVYTGGKRVCDWEPWIVSKCGYPEGNVEPTAEQATHCEALFGDWDKLDQPTRDYLCSAAR